MSIDVLKRQPITADDAAARRAAQIHKRTARLERMARTTQGTRDRISDVELGQSDMEARLALLEGAGPHAAAVPLVIAADETYIIADNTQVLYAREIVVDGEIVFAGGELIRV